MKLISTLIACLLVCPGVVPASSLLPSAGLFDFCNGRADDSPDCVTPPTVIYSPEPKYPDSERKARREGDVVLRLVVGTDGAAQDISVVRSLSPDFDKAAIEAVQTWVFTPAKKNGRTIPYRMQIQVGFHLRR